ncbi:LemA family protein [Candidatus Bipolaricaulota bacterium]|nr:LemA family protein [Candidatus Bipolaricaulota bacterium]
MTGGAVAAVVAGVALLYAISMYNTLIRTRQHVRESWSDIDAELKRRYDLVPNLVETVRGYAQHEEALLRAVAEARARAMGSEGSPADQAGDENRLIGALRQLLAVSEAYPDLKANTSFLELQKELSNTEDRIQAARRLYNANVRALNTRVHVFPSNIVASMFAIREATFFEIESIVREELPTV